SSLLSRLTDPTHSSCNTRLCRILSLSFFFFHDTPPTEIYTLSLHDALPISKIGGQWSIRPAHDSQISRRYLDKTNVLQTTFASETGKIVLTDFMSVTSEGTKRTLLWPEHEIVRQIKCDEGKVALIIEFNPRLDYGRAAPKIKNAGALGWRTDIAADLLTLRSAIDLEQ